MSKQSILKEIKEKFEKRKSQIRNEYENLEEKMKKEKEMRIANSEKEFRKEFSVALRELLGEEDCEWLNKWLVTNKEKEAEQAEKRKKKNRANELRQMSPEDYLFGYLSDAEFEKRINQSREANKPEDVERLTSILVKLRQEKAWVNGTLL
ncbi:MAG: hypothetical protein ABSA75_14970 [Candidatus Bathyarchaeia archaeon]|jgi:hypothetical protein